MHDIVSALCQHSEIYSEQTLGISQSNPKSNIITPYTIIEGGLSREHSLCIITSMFLLKIFFVHVCGCVHTQLGMCLCVGPMHYICGGRK